METLPFTPAPRVTKDGRLKIFKFRSFDKFFFSFLQMRQTTVNPSADNTNNHYF